jgi:hypothetical protein
MLRQLQRIGFDDNPQTRELLKRAMKEILNDSSNILRTQADGTVVRESLLAGPGGMMKVETVWDGVKLITAKLIGGP